MDNKKFLKKLNILYVEDSLKTAEMFTKILKRMFANVYTASNGKIGLQLYKDNPIDIIVSDINMPIMDGLIMCKHIREENKDIPIILTTARNETDTLLEAIELNINHYLIKPIILNQLVNKLYKVCEKIQAEETKNLLKQYKNVVDKNLIVKKFDLEGKNTYINKQYEILSNYTKDELLGSKFDFDVIKDTSIEKTYEIWEALKNKKTWEGKLKKRTKYNQEYIVSASFSPILDFNNNIIEYISLSKDITDSEVLNNSLISEIDTYKGDVTSKRHLLNEYQNMVNHSNLLVKIDTNLKITYVNKKFLEVTNYDTSDLIQKDISFILSNLEKEDISLILESLIANKNIQKIVTFKNEEAISYINFNFTIIKDQFGNTLEYVALGNDITETINLHQEIEDTQKDVIFTLGSIAESRSNETANHVKRVAEYSYILAKKYGLEEKEAQLLKIASPMHDIGKVGIPDSILNKPGKLTQDEFHIMKSHAEIGYEMLKNSNREILKAAAKVSYEHHEKWDGSGYPRRLKGDNIHIYGRITAIADVFDALGSARCYKEAWPLKKVLDLIKNESGKHFDPKLVDLMLDNLDDFLLVRDSYIDKF
ncbi:hypothetical protein LPB137_04355 [Poseidonibacter parvus]|uniref:Response regulator receiver protein n=1 Tax=Poseidonibacter parvus TaxID=1850254 RepID=A0A1P8KKS8_9BACT|nr:HD domain-containing phosphohydrolase [Poseidonibacter parvus]APW65126.1 hypothetical protein LPB137_04355 [Poseidonibacter parvus]